MGTISKFLSVSDKVERYAKKIKATIQHPKPREEQQAKKIKIKIQRPEPIAGLYTVLGFESREGFDNKINKLVIKEIWQLFVNCLEKEIGYTANEEVIKNIVCKIAKGHLGNAFIKTEHIILNKKQGNKKREKAIEKAIGILKRMNSQKALEELSIIKK